MHLSTQLAPQLARVQGDRLQLQQVVLNLTINAIQAMSAADGGPRELLISTESIGSEEVRVGVRDTGPGLSPESLPRLFEPFYTTKAGGLGMGLVICRSIIEAHGGTTVGDGVRATGSPISVHDSYQPKCSVVIRRCRLLALRDVLRRRASLVANGAKRTSQKAREDVGYGPTGDIA